MAKKRLGKFKTGNTVPTISVLELDATGEGEATVLGLRSFPDSVQGVTDARALFIRLVREDGDEDADADDVLTDEEIEGFVNDGRYANGDYILLLLASDPK